MWYFSDSLHTHTKHIDLDSVKEDVCLSGLNITAEWEALMLCIYEFLDSNLGLETSYPD
jgi:hypothetical protein